MLSERDPRTGIRPETYELFKRILKILEPPPDITLSQWADEYRYLSSEFAAEPGRWHTDRAPYQREPMDAITNTHTRKVVLMWAAQMGKTQSTILNTIGYYMHYEPCAILWLEPTVEASEKGSKTFLAPMMRDTPVLAGLTSHRSRDKNDTIREKNFPGGHITMQGANSPTGLSMLPIRVLLADEIDRYPASAGNEGDPLALAEKRMTAFWDSKEIVTSTPTIKGFSKIEAEYEHSTREVWNVPCPKCGKYQPLTWGKIKFDKDAFRDGTNTEVGMECEHCREISDQYEWKALFGKGKYIAEFPRRKTRGFYVNRFASLLSPWENAVEEFLDANDEAKNGNREPLKVWTNTVLAETWDEEGVQLDEQELMARAEEYGADVPDAVIALTCGVDTQDDRFEYEIVGWGLGKESWGIEKGEIYGDLKGPEIFDRLDKLLLRTFTKKDGTTLTITAACIDSQGHFTNQVDRFCLPRWGRNVWSIKGKGGMDVPFISNPTTNNRVKTPKFTLGVDTGKVLIYDRLKVELPRGKAGACPGYCHFPIGRGYDDKYYKGLTAEKRIITYKKGRATTAWVLKNQGYRRNEPLDIRNYATAAMEIARLPLEPIEVKPKKKRVRRVRSGGIGGDEL